MAKDKATQATGASSECSPGKISANDASQNPTASSSRWTRLTKLFIKWYEYVLDGVWSDTRRSWNVNLLKTLNLSLRSFLNTDLQVRAAGLTYQTLLAIVPALALLFAIGRGFGFQNILETQLFNSFPAQREALTEAFNFVDSYLAQSSEGIFVGIGIVFLLWTLISLISSVENSFNIVWGIRHGRSFWRKLTDYTAIFLILPILMICASGITVFMSSTLQAALPFESITPVISWLLDFASLALTWLFFAGSYMLIPNTKVRLKNALIAGILAGTAFSLLQWLFVSGQIYVTRYNAIYGSFAFLPLLLIWLQLVWLITLSGAVLCYSSQNIFQFNFSNEIAKISEEYNMRILVAVMTVCVDRFTTGKAPMNDQQIASTYGLPISIVTASINRLIECNLLIRVVTKHGDDTYAVSPSADPSRLTIGEFLRRIRTFGSSEFIPEFNKRFKCVNTIIDKISDASSAEADNIPITSLKIYQENENSDCN